MDVLHNYPLKREIEYGDDDRAGNEEATISVSSAVKTIQIKSHFRKIRFKVSFHFELVYHFLAELSRVSMQ
jgi:hypothetical protein